MRIFACLFALCMAVFLATACKKHAITPPLAQLPAETQIGARTFGCLINGKAFKPKGISLTPILQCYYQNLHDIYSSGYFFGLHAVDHSNPENLLYVGIFADSLQIKDTGVIPLTEYHVNGKAAGDYGIYKTGVNPVHYLTNKLCKGELNIKKLDSVNQIISGTFWFNGVNDNGDTVKITDGRFDVHYTK